MEKLDSLKRCLECGYILQGLTYNRCPECGRGYDPKNPATFRSGNDKPQILRRYLRLAIVASALPWVGVALKVALKYKAPVAALIVLMFPAWAILLNEAVHAFAPYVKMGLARRSSPWPGGIYAVEIMQIGLTIIVLLSCVPPFILVCVL